MSKARRAGMTMMELVVVIVIMIALAGLIVPLTAPVTDSSGDITTRTSMMQIRDVIVTRYWPDMDKLAKRTTGDWAGTWIDGFPQALPTFPSPDRGVNPQLLFLFMNPAPGTTYDPVTRRGWNGPYLQHNGAKYNKPLELAFASDAYGIKDDPTVLDGWGQPIILQRPDGGITTIPNPSELDIMKKCSRLVSSGADRIYSTPANKLELTKKECGDDIVLYLFSPDVRPES